MKSAGCCWRRRPSRLDARVYIKRREAGEAFPAGHPRPRWPRRCRSTRPSSANLQVRSKTGLKVPGIVARWEKRRVARKQPRLRSPAWTTRRSIGCWIGSLTTVAHGRSTTCASFRPAGPAASISARVPGGFCPNAARMYADRYRYGEWRCAGCCRECLNRDTCSTACRFVVAERPPKEPEPAQCPEIRQQTTHGSRI